MPHYRDDPALQAAAVAPPHPISALPPAATILGRIARSYNVIGGVADRLGALAGVEPMAALAVWYVESGGAAFVPGKPIMRFENHKFFRFWGKDHAAAFDAQFQMGGRNGVPGASHQNHRVRPGGAGAWRSFHGDQTKEYDVLALATQLGGKDAACMSASFGGAQIMGFNHDACGYATATAMFDAFAADPRWQVLGFFDFCRSNALMVDIRDHHWIDFGQRYNGDGAVYGPRLKEAYDLKPQFDALPRS